MCKTLKTSSKTRTSGAAKTKTTGRQVMLPKKTSNTPKNKGGNV